MASLLPSLPSDGEDPPLEEEEDESSSGDEHEMDRSFEFGGILGEDGGMSLSLSHHPLLESASGTDGWSYQTALSNLQKTEKPSTVPRLDVHSLITAKRKSFQNPNDEEEEEEKRKSNDAESADEQSEEEEKGYSSSDDESDDDDDDDDDEELPPPDDSHRDLDDDVLKTRAGSKEKEVEPADDEEEESDGEEEDDSSSENENVEDRREAAKAAAFFDDEPLRNQSSSSSSQQQQEIEVFHQLSLSRPLLRGVAAMGFVKPTPIQAVVLPLALAGRDICASAVTGSGKTAAFVLPILERLLHRYAGRTKAVILTPTRELAAQCIGMLTTFAQFTKLRACLIVGGAKNVQAQAAELRTRPEIVVATPGRLLDHVTNSAGVTLEEVEFLVLDEADRLLDLGFQEEVHEIIKSCPVARQTLLFSATMNTKVDDLISLSLKRPVRVRITDKEKNKDTIEVAPRLEQEFVRIRSGNEGINREGMLLSLLTRTFTKQTIVFFDTKVTAHRLMILCGLCGIQCAELHGNLTQQQRLTALEEFRLGRVDVLLATDLASRGLDISGIATVINFEMPSQIETYIHRIGRTARAGRGGKSCTLIGEGRRHLMKELIKDADSKKKRKKKTKKMSQERNSKANNNNYESGVIRSRSIPAAVVSHFVTKIQSLESHLQEVLQAEAVAKMDRMAEMEAIKAQHIIEHADEIQARPPREWFASNQQKRQTKIKAAERQQLIAEKAGTGVHRMTRKKRRKREAEQAFAAAAPLDNDESGGSNDDAQAANKKRPFVDIKSAVRKQKRQLEVKEKEAYNTTINDDDNDDKATNKKKKKKKKVGQDSAGDSSLFAEEKVAFAPRKNNKNGKQDSASSAPPKMFQSAYNFRGYDPDRQLGKKRGNKAFKSKSKYKRRK